MEKAGNSWQPPRLARGEEGFFPDPRILHTIEAKRQRALGEIAASMRRSPGPCSTRLSTEAQHSFLAHGFAPDQPSPLLLTHNPVPGPVPEGFMNEPPPHPDPVPGPFPESLVITCPYVAGPLIACP
ncbi:hypothetical protein CRENBAI_017729 [Crenichthys baileyi]|uniref:Uncharacterized protein n=1 Tax=Crenichthys baileyi TaxID=28760 RepID=A0AAV9SR92_9TELE